MIAILEMLVAAAMVLGQSSSAEQFDEELRPIEAVDDVFIEDLTWMEVRDAIASGKTTAIVATGGIEQNGPYVVTGKHNVVLQATTEAIARRLGNALVAPIIKLVPEGAHDPPSGHMRYPGTISLREETFEAVLSEVGTSLKVHGFLDIVLLGDSGGNQRGMKAVADALNERFRGEAVRFHFIPEYYEADMWSYDYLKKIGIFQQPDVKSASRAGIHDDYHYDAIMMTVDPETVRMEQRIARGLFSINGVELSPAEQTIANGRKLVDYRAELTVVAIEKAIASAERP